MSAIFKENFKSNYWKIFEKIKIDYLFVYFFGNQLISTFDPKNAFLSGFHSKNRRIIEYAYEYKIDEDDFKGNKEDYEGREQ